MTPARTFGTAFALLLFSPTPTLAEIEQIIVTATKRAENLQDLPLTVQATDGDELRALRADTAEDVLSLFANLSVNGSV